MENKKVANVFYILHLGFGSWKCLPDDWSVYNKVKNYSHPFVKETIVDLVERICSEPRLTYSSSPHQTVC